MSLWGCCLLTSDRVDGFFFVDQMTGLVDDCHQGVQIARPFVENILGRFLLFEGDDVLQTIDLRVDRLVRDQRGKELFRFVFAQIEKIGHLLRSDTSVIFSHDSHVLQRQRLTSPERERGRMTLHVRRHELWNLPKTSLRLFSCWKPPWPVPLHFPSSNPSRSSSEGLSNGSILASWISVTILLKERHADGEEHRAEKSLVVSLVFGNLFEILIEKQSMQEIGLFVVVGRQGQVEHDVLQGLFHLLSILLDSRCVVEMFVMLTNVEIVSLEQIHFDHQAIIFQFQILREREDREKKERERWVRERLHLRRLWCWSSWRWFAFECNRSSLNRDAFAPVGIRSSRVDPSCRRFPPESEFEEWKRRRERETDLKFLKDLCGFFSLSLSFVDIGQFLRQSRSFVLDEDLKPNISSSFTDRWQRGFLLCPTSPFAASRSVSVWCRGRVSSPPVHRLLAPSWWSPVSVDFDVWREWWCVHSALPSDEQRNNISQWQREFDRWRSHRPPEKSKIRQKERSNGISLTVRVCFSKGNTRSRTSFSFEGS